MSNMLNEFIRKFTEVAHENGIQNLEFYSETEKNVSVNAYQGRAWKSQECEVTSCYIQGEYKGMTGAVSVEDLSEEQFEEAIHLLKMTAEMNHTPFRASNLSASKVTKDFTNSSMDELTKGILSAEAAVKEKYPELNKFNSADCDETIRTIQIQNDKGICMEDTIKYASAWLQAEALDGDVVQTSASACVVQNASDIDFEQMFEEAAEDACNMKGAKPVATGKYPVVLKNSIICEMLSMYMSAFGADQVRKKLSKLSENKDTQAASEVVCLSEEPALAEGVNNRAFDDEGNPTAAKKLIEKGVLKQFLYNQEEAEMAGTKSTGNGFKKSYKGKPEIGVSNLVLHGQDKSITTLLAEMQNGLYITSCDGMFACADVVSGDFALISRGYLVESGKPVRPVSQITIAGDFFDMIKEIQALGNDYRTMFTPAGAFVTPSVFVKELVVSGL